MALYLGCKVRLSRCHHYSPFSGPVSVPFLLVAIAVVIVLLLKLQRLFSLLLLHWHCGDISLLCSCTLCIVLCCCPLFQPGLLVLQRSPSSLLSFYARTLSHGCCSSSLFLSTFNCFIVLHFCAALLICISDGDPKANRQTG